MTQVHLGINIGLQYIRNTSEYIPKLQLHQQYNHYLNSTIFDSQEKTCKNTECKDKNMKDRSSENKC